MKKRIFAILFTTFTLMFSSSVFAHSGNTDFFGGHNDYNNVSGLGSYHYHCGGNPPHLHYNGVCPYRTTYTYTNPSSYKQTNTQTTKSTTQSQPQKEVPKEVPTKVTVDGNAIAGPVLWYKNNYFVPVNQLANNLSASVLPVTEDMVLQVKRGEGHVYIETVPDFKSQYMDMFVIFISMYGNDKYYHKIDCPMMDKNGGLAAYLSIDEGFAELGLLDSVSPCPICMK